MNTSQARRVSRGETVESAQWRPVRMGEQSGEVSRARRLGVPAKYGEIGAKQQRMFGRHRKRKLLQLFLVRRDN